MKSQQVIENFESGIKANSGNYFTDGQALFLFGNKIAELRENQVWFTLAGWNSSTTKKALNWLSNVSIHSRNGVIKNFDEEIESDKWYKVSDF